MNGKQYEENTEPLLAQLHELNESSDHALFHAVTDYLEDLVHEHYAAVVDDGEEFDNEPKEHCRLAMIKDLEVLRSEVIPSLLAALKVE